ncbi:unnamed protein product [Clonostachys byssicola]|uniref:Zn(2)-C6 fungal-type domain-containing protein n=1 Tax=Clonostachys byssicola TaxID=160290 RepID=A0A9N9UIS9_9HYPO|nr:unnamed protein product [Clonostachys byssicola]
MPSNGCWTCRDRKIRCDEGRPKCQKCAQSNRECRGYGLKLSWPGAKSKRSLIGNSSRGSTARKSQGSIFLHTDFLDMEIHQFLSKSAGRQVHGESNRDLLSLNRPVTIHWKPFQLRSTEIDLLTYFESVASNTLATFNQTRSELCGLLFRLALLDTTSSSKCVLWSILALASLDRNGNQYQTMQLKLTAVALLKSTSTDGMDDAEAVRHIAAGMIMTTFEIHSNEDRDSQWTWFLCGSGRLMHRTLHVLEALGSDGSLLHDWASYHGAMTGFTLRHWRRMAPISTSVGSEMPDTRMVRPPPVCSPSTHKSMGLPENSHNFLKLVRDIFHSILQPSNVGYHDPAYTETLKNWEHRVANYAVSYVKNTKTDRTSIRGWDDNFQLELFKLALLIYIERSARSSSGQSEKVTSYTQRGFAILSQMNYCELSFPLFIIGSEAQSDEERTLILGLVKSGDANQSHPLSRLESMLQAVWAQNDLETNYELDYTMKLDTVMTSSPCLPSFA